MKKTLLALDVDGVFNSLGSNQRGLVNSRVGPWSISWRPSILPELRTILSSEGMEPAWLSTWVKTPKLLDSVEKLLGLEPFPHRAAFPRMILETHHGLSKPLSLEPMSRYWWKFQALDDLVKSVQPNRLVWLDDQLGYGTHPKRWRPRKDSVSYLKTVPAAYGLRPKDVRELSLWLEETL